MSDVDTSAEAVEGLAKHHDLLHPKVEKVTLFGDTSQKTADVLRALKAEREGLKVSRDAWSKAVGAIVSAIPLGDVIKASGTLGDTIDYVKSAIAERDELRRQLAEAQKPAPKGYPINLLVSGTIQAHQIADNLGSGKIDKMEPFTRYDAARNALAEAWDGALEECMGIARLAYTGDADGRDIAIAIEDLKTKGPGA